MLPMILFYNLPSSFQFFSHCLKKIFLGLIVRFIVCRFLCYKYEQNVSRKDSNLKGTNIYINKDFCKKVKEYRTKNKFTYISYRTLNVSDGRKAKNGGEALLFSFVSILILIHQTYTL